MASRFSGQTPIFGVVFFVYKSLMGIARQKKLKKFKILTRKPRSHFRILIYRTWRIVTTKASFRLFICALVFASNSGHFRINEFLLFFTPLLLLNYFLFNLFLFLQKKWGGGAKAPPSPSLFRGPSLDCGFKIFALDLLLLYFCYLLF